MNAFSEYSIFLKKFWTSFYEQAAQTRIPTYDDYSTVNEQPSEHTEHTEQEVVAEASAHHYEDQQVDDSYQSRASTENSFMPGQAAFSSTPATTSRIAPLNSFASQTMDATRTHSGTMEASLARLDREIQSLSIEDESRAEGSTITNLFTSPDQSSRSFRGKGKGKEQSQPLLRNLLKQNLYSGNDSSSIDPSFHTSPLKPRGKLKTPIPKNYNPYLPPNADPRDWSGVVDLRDPTLSTPHRSSRYGQPSSRGNPTTSPDDTDDDSWEGGLPPGMSPPVLMSPARPPRSYAELGLLKLGQTPTKEAANRITRDLVSDIQNKGGLNRPPFSYGNSGVESSLSTVPSPPSLSRYRNKGYDSDPSYSSMDSRGSMTATAPSDPPAVSTPYSRNEPAHSLASEALITPESYNQRRYTPTPYLDRYSFSDDKIHSAENPSAAFLMASKRRTADDSLDSLDDEAGFDVVPIRPFARMQKGYDDGAWSDDESFSGPSEQNEVSETLFGVRPNQPGGNADGLRLHGLKYDDATSLLARAAQTVDNSPTPAHVDRR